MVWEKTVAHDHTTTHASGPNAGLLLGWIPDSTKTEPATRVCPGCGQGRTIDDYERTAGEDREKTFVRWTKRKSKCTACVSSR